MNTHRFVWHDLNTKDLERAKRFYGELFGWKFGSSDNGPYLHIEVGNQMIGGMRQQGVDERTPPHWLGYVAVDDVAGMVGKIAAASGRVYMPTKVMDGVGTFAVTADPTGGVFAPWKSARAGEDKEAEGDSPLFTFTWDELFTTDVAAATKFYTSVFGWTAETMPMGPGETYTMFMRPGTTNAQGKPRGAGGMMKAPEMVPHSFWMPYIAVDDTDKVTAKAQRFGAKIDVAPQDIPGMGRFSSWRDDQGAAIAVIAFARK